MMCQIHLCFSHTVVQGWVYSCEYSKEFILVSLINYCITYLLYNYKSTFANPCIT